MTLVKVMWLDSGTHIDHGWASKEDYLKDTDMVRQNVVTVGILMHEDEDKVVVALTYDPGRDSWYGAELIARQNVHSITYLAEA